MARTLSLGSGSPAYFLTLGRNVLALLEALSIAAFAIWASAEISPALVSDILSACK